MPITSRPFGLTSDGRAVTCYALTNSAGASVEVLDYGAATRSVTLPGGRNVCLGFDTVAGYEARTTYSGAIVGRHAGRIGGGEFTLAGRAYKLPINNGPNHHHGGLEGFSHKLWNVSAEGERLILTYTSPHGEEGYPGALTVTTTYQWTDDRTLSVTLDGLCDQDTVLSLTHHGYWRMADAPMGDHTFQVHAPTVAAADGNTLPTGELMAVGGTPFDFRAPRRLGAAWGGSHPQLIPGVGFDHTFPVPGDGLREMGKLSWGDLELAVSSTLPALHLYTGVEGWAALECQFIPDAMHHPHFPSTVLPAGQRWRHIIQYRFTQKEV